MLARPLTSERFDDTTFFAGTGIVVLALTVLGVAIRWEDLDALAALLLGSGILGGAAWVVAGWAVWRRRPWAPWFVAGAVALALVLHIALLGLWEFWNLVLVLTLWVWVEKARGAIPS